LPVEALISSTAFSPLPSSRHSTDKGRRRRGRRRRRRPADLLLEVGHDGSDGLNDGDNK